MAVSAPETVRTIIEGAEPDRVRRAVADFVLEHSEKIRAIARRKLTAATRSVHDSEDVCSSVARRLDHLAARGELRPRSEAELWALIKVVARNTAVSKTRLIERAREILTDDGPLAYEMLRRLNACQGDEDATVLLHRTMMILTDAKDRQVLALQLRGASHAAIGSLLGISEAASRQRWMSIRRRLAERLAEGGFDA